MLRRSIIVSIVIEPPSPRSLFWRTGTLRGGSSRIMRKPSANWCRFPQRLGKKPMVQLTLLPELSPHMNMWGDLRRFFWVSAGHFAILRTNETGIRREA